MKRIFYLILIIPIFLISCEITPEALFSVDKPEPEVGEEVFFTNHSFNAERFEWDFGDGSYSEEINPIHIYTGTGSYQVKLKAISESGFSAEAIKVIDVKIPTLLEIEVLEYYDKYPVANASVILYPTLSDWDNERNSITEGFTDANGIVLFWSSKISLLRRYMGSPS
jgi:PKD repeat protein